VKYHWVLQERQRRSLLMGCVRHCGRSPDHEGRLALICADAVLIDNSARFDAIRQSLSNDRNFGASCFLSFSNIETEAATMGDSLYIQTADGN
jgi:hypothetical protein